MEIEAILAGLKVLKIILWYHSQLSIDLFIFRTANLVNGKSLFCS